MALTVFDLVGVMRLDKGQYDAGMASAEGTAKRSHAWLGAVGTGLRVMGGAFLGAGAAGITMGLKIAAGQQNAEIAFTTMLGSGEKARAFLDDLAGFAAKTPFEFPELQTAASSLISAGFEAGKVIPIMTTLGNVTSGMGTGAEGVKRATIALQQMSAAGRITGEDLNQLRDAGVPVFDLLAAATGKSKEEVAELAQAGKLGKEEMQQLFDALESGKGMERFAGLMEAQSATLTGTLSTLKDAVGMNLAEMVQPIVPILTRLIPQGAALIEAGFDRLNPKIAVGVAWLERAAGEGGVLRESALRVVGAVREVVDWIRQAVGQGGELSRTWSEVQAGAQPVVDQLHAISDGGGGASGMWERLTAAVAGIDWSTVGEQIAGLIDSGERLAPAFGEFLEQMPSLTDIVTPAGVVLGFLADHVDTLVEYMPWLVAAVIAFKVAQAAANLVAAATPALRIAEIRANQQLAASQRALTAAVKGQTVATRVGAVTETTHTTAKNGGRLASLRALAATVAHTVAEKARAVVTKAGAAAQWLLNAAMSANPIMLVVIAVAALVAGLIYAYRHSETFRRIVDAAFRAVGEAARWLWETILRPVFDLWIGYFKMLWEGAKLLARGVIAAWQAIVAAVQTAITAVIEFFGGLITWVGELPGRLVAIAGHMWVWVSEKAALIRDAVVGAVAGFFEWVGALPSTIAARAGDVWAWITNQAKLIKYNVIEGLVAFWNWLSTLPSVLASKAGDVWGWLVSAAARAASAAWQAIKDQFTGGGGGDTGRGIGGLDGNPLTPLARGGIVTRPTLALIGEGRESEAVVPLSRLDAMLERAYAAGRAGSDGAAAGRPIAITIERNGPIARPDHEVAADAYEGVELALWATGV